MNWSLLWLKLFGTTTLFGFDVGLWVALGASALVAILMNVVFWTRKPHH